MIGFKTKIVSSVVLLSVLFVSQAHSQSLSPSQRCQKQAFNLHFDNTLKVRILYYGHSDFRELKKAALIVPPMGGTNLIDRKYGRYFCEKGLPSIILDEWTGSNERFDPFDLSSHQREIESGKNAFLALVRYLKETKIAVFSTSKGGIGVSCFLNEFPSNVSSLVSVVAGAPLHLTISRSNQEDLKFLREVRMEKFKLKTYAEYDQLIKDSLNIKTSPRNSNVKLAMVIAEKDEAVPSYLQDHLIDLWQPDQHWKLENNHFFTIVFSFRRLRDKILDFMEASF